MELTEKDVPGAVMNEPLESASVSALVASLSCSKSTNIMEKGYTN